MTASEEAPYHAHIYAQADEHAAAEKLRERLSAEAWVLFIGRLTEGKAGPHPIPQFEVHFLSRSLDLLLPIVRASGLRALVHPLTQDDHADHTSLAHWIGEPLDLDLATLDPPGANKGIARFGKSDF